MTVGGAGRHNAAMGCPTQARPHAALVPRHRPDRTPRWSSDTGHRASPQPTVASVTVPPSIVTLMRVVE